MGHDYVDIEGERAAVVAHSDVVVVGAGPAGLSAAVAAARRGATVTLLERSGILGGMASGGMVLVLDDMVSGDEISVRGIAQEYVERLERIGLAVYPPESDRRLSPETWRRWARWGTFDFYKPGRVKPIVYAVAFDPDGWKRVSQDLVTENGIDLRMHSFYSGPVMRDGRLAGAIVRTKSGPQAVLGDVVVDASGDADVVASVGETFEEGRYIVTTVFRLGGVDTDRSERFDEDEVAESKRVHDKIRSILGGAWVLWWLKTPLPGVVWCNCPHLSGYDGISVQDLTAADLEGRRRMTEAVEFARRELPGFENAHILDVAPQIGVRQTRLLQGEYVVTKDDVLGKRRFTDSIARGRDYFTPYRSLLPRTVEGLIVAGRHYSAAPDAQRISREIPPCMAMGEAAGTAAHLALDSGRELRDIDVLRLQRYLIEQGADPGVSLDDLEVPSAGGPR